MNDTNIDKQDESLDSHFTFIKQWEIVQAHWEKKRSQYQTEAETVKDPKTKLQIQKNIDTCQDVIDTCVGLISTLDKSNSEQSSEQITSPILSRLSSPTGSQSLKKTSTFEVLKSQKKELKFLNKLILGSLLPVFILVAILAAIFRPRDICKVAPNGTYSESGLANWVIKTLTNNERYKNTLKTISIGQYGCTIILKGEVDSQKINDEIIDIVKNIEIPSQSYESQFRTQLQLGNRTMIKAVDEVVSQIKVIPKSPKKLRS